MTGEEEPTRLDHPNQQVVRPDASGPADTGEGAGKPKRGPGRPAGAKTKDKADPEPDATKTAQEGS